LPSIQSGKVPVAFLRVELHCKAARAACGVGGPILPPTVEKRANIAVVLPTALKILTARHLHWPLTNVLRLGIMPTLSPYLLPLVLNKLYQGFPDNQLVLREDLTDNLLVALEAYKLNAVPVLILNQTSVYPNNAARH
jgi:hypothetical protein